MPAAIALPMLIGGGISAATSIAGAKMASGAAKDAAQAQQQAANRALSLQQQMFQQAQSMGQSQNAAAQQSFAPYQQAGGAALNALYARLGLGQFGAGQGRPYQGLPQMPPMVQPSAQMAPQTLPAGPVWSWGRALSSGTPPLPRMAPTGPMMSRGPWSGFAGLMTGR